jgi:uncharacterized membrane protein
VVIQPISGAALVWMTGTSAMTPWLVASSALYLLVGLCWLPVVWIQKTVRDLAAEAQKTGAPLSERYHRLFRIWFILGWPAFIAVIAILVLMIAKPTL